MDELGVSINWGWDPDIDFKKLQLLLLEKVRLIGFLAGASGFFRSIEVGKM